MVADALGLPQAPWRAAIPAESGYCGLMPFGVNIWEILILLLVALLVFGPKRLPEMGRSLGRGMREFKQGVTGADEERELAAPPPRATNGAEEREPADRSRVQIPVNRPPD